MTKNVYYTYKQITEAFNEFFKSSYAARSYNGNETDRIQLDIIISSLIYLLESKRKNKSNGENIWAEIIHSKYLMKHIIAYPFKYKKFKDNAGQPGFSEECRKFYDKKEKLMIKKIMKIEDKLIKKDRK